RAGVSRGEDNMADAWYYAQNGQQYGPIPGSQLQQLAAAGRLQPGDLVWQEGMPHWTPASSVTNLIPAHLLAGPAPPAAPPAPAGGGHAAPAGAAPDRRRRHQPTPLPPGPRRRQ